MKDVLALTVAALLAAAAAAAQDGPLPRPDATAASGSASAAEDGLAPAAAAPPEDGLLSDAELDTLLAPFALYPDALLTQIMVAATFPLDVVKADRWAEANAGLPAGERNSAAEAQGWDPSVATLAAGFPVVVDRMATDLDATETLGDAVLAQTDDVLASVQRLRGQAAAVGQLASNEAQTIETDDEGAISIAPADPERVYVPSYDPNVVYAAAPAGASYVTTDAVGYGPGNWLATGAIAFGSALLVDEIFDDDDDWNGYWHDPPRYHVDWDDGDFYPRPDRKIDIEGDVNIDRDRVVIGDRPLDPDRAAALRARVDAGDAPKLAAARDRLGGLDPDDPRRPGAFAADPARRDEARRKLEARREGGGAGAALAGAGAGAGLAAAGRSDAAAAARARVEAAGGADAVRSKIQASGGADAARARIEAAGGAEAARAKLQAGGGDAARAKISAAKARQAAAPAKKAPTDRALTPGTGGAAKVEAARARADKSRSPAAKAAAAKHKPVGKPSAARAAAKKPNPKPAAKSTAFKKPQGGGARAGKASSRGRHSAGRARRR